MDGLWNSQAAVAVAAGLAFVLVRPVLVVRPCARSLARSLSSVALTPPL